MITKVLILECDYCPRTTRIKGGFVTEEGLLRAAAERGWTRKPDPVVSYSTNDRCPKCSKAAQR
jgi:hypothetical protein